MSANRANINWHLHSMVAGFPGQEPEPIVIYRTLAGITLCVGDTVPSGSGYAPGCIFIHHDGASTDYLYVNNGTATTADFEKVLDVNNVLAQIQSEHLSGSASGVGPSPLIWDDAPVLEVMLDPTKGWYWFEDFLGEGDETNVGAEVTQKTSGTFTDDPSLAGGVYVVDSGAAADNQGPSVFWPGHQLVPASGTKIYFECRVKLSNDAGDYFIGLADDATVDILNGGTIITDKDMAGFFRDDGTTDAAMSYQVGDGDSVDTADDIIDDVDKTKYEKFGIVIDGVSSVKFYHKGALVKTVMDTNDICDGIICPAIQVENDAATQSKLYIDWIRVLAYHASGSSVRVA